MADDTPAQEEPSQAGASPLSVSIYHSALIPAAGSRPQPRGDIIPPPPPHPTVIRRSTIYDCIQRNPELQEFRYHVIGAVCDRAQEVVFDAVDNRDVQTSLKVLGYVASGVEKQTKH
jgi:hypothetical protein